MCRQVDKDPRILIEGHEDDIYKVAVHPTDPNIFATTCQSGRVRLWDKSKLDCVRSATAGFPIIGVAFSFEQYPLADGKTKGFHLAVRGGS